VLVFRWSSCQLKQAHDLAKTRQCWYECVWCVPLFVNTIKDEHELSGSDSHAITTAIAK